MPALADEGKDNVCEDKTFSEFFAEMMRYQMELSGVWRDVFGQVNPLSMEDTQQIANMVKKHWQRVEERTKALFPEKSTVGPDFIQKQKELYIYCMQSYSLMLQELLTSPIFLNTMKENIDASLSRKIQLDRMRDETLKSMGIPSRKDLQEIHHSLYIINKKLDKLNDALSNKGDTDNPE